MAGPHELPDDQPQPDRHGHLAPLEDGLSFINTRERVRGGWVDRLDSAAAALAWLSGHNLLHDDTRERLLAVWTTSPEAGARALDRIRSVRASMRELIEATVSRRAPAPEELRVINRALRAHYVYVLVPALDGVSMSHKHLGDPIEGALARLTESLAREVSQGLPERLRICANPDCAEAFLDRSRTGRRKWCNMATCGNRAKAARHRERRREASLVAGAPVQAPALAEGTAVS